MNFENRLNMKKLKFIFYIVLGISMYSCEDIFIRPAKSDQNLEDFESAWKRVKDVYPYLEFKNIDWDSIYSVYRPRAAAARGDEFFLVLHDLLAELKDGHARYQTEGGGEVYPFYPQRHFKDRHAYSPFVVRKYFETEPQVSASGVIEYGIIPGNIGYAFLSDFHHNYLEKDFPGVLDHLKSTKGLILDVRHKHGGYADNIEAVVSRFLTQPIVRPDCYWLFNKEPNSTWLPQGPFIYIKPVVILINGSTFSAGELFAEISKQLPTVTVVGDTTGGGSCGGNFRYYLPSGKKIYVGALDQRRYDGLPWEWLGIAPDIRVEQTEADIINGRDKQLEFAINMLK
jgi:hypothetical protein